MERAQKIENRNSVTNSISEAPKEIKKKKRRGLKKGCCIISIITFILLTCSSIGAFLWAGGWVKEATCNVVKEDSAIWDKFECLVEDEKVLKVENSVSEEISEESKELISKHEDAVIDVVNKTSPAVVSIAVVSEKISPSQGENITDDIGTGFIVGSDGVIMTNQHVVSQKNVEYNVFIDGKAEPYKVEEIHRDPANDVAIIVINATGLPTLELGDSSNLEIGQFVMAIGNPLGNRGTVTTGIVSGLGREVSVEEPGEYGFYNGTVQKFDDVIQTDAAINPGNSGGPLLDSSGKVIGINFATSGFDNISFALPINQPKFRLAEFESKGKFSKPYIGVTFDVITEYDAYFYDDVVPGAFITEVVSESPADKAGLEEGDIITQVEDEVVGSNLATVIQGYKVGEEVVLTVWRDGEYEEIKIVLGETPGVE